MSLVVWVKSVRVRESFRVRLDLIDLIGSTQVTKVQKCQKKKTLLAILLSVMEAFWQLYTSGNLIQKILDSGNRVTLTRNDNLNPEEENATTTPTAAAAPGLTLESVTGGSRGAGGSEAVGQNTAIGSLAHSLNSSPSYQFHPRSYQRQRRRRRCCCTRPQMSFANCSNSLTGPTDSARLAASSSSFPSLDCSSVIE